jgi:hypothetical protein
MTIKAIHSEDAESAVVVCDRFHPDSKPLIFRLAFILQPQLRADFGGTQCETAIFGTILDVHASRAGLEAEVSSRDQDEFDFILFPGNYESWLPEDVVSQVADIATSFLQGSAKAVGILDASAEYDGFPCFACANLLRHKSSKVAPSAKSCRQFLLLLEDDKDRHSPERPIIRPLWAMAASQEVVEGHLVEFNHTTPQIANDDWRGTRLPSSAGLR